MQLIEKKEMRDIEIDHESDLQCTVNNKGKSFKISVLDHPIISLRPVTILEDGSRMILVYLPVREKEISEKETESKFINKAFFAIHNPDSGEEQKLILPIEHDALKENFRIDVLPKWIESRWQYENMSGWLKESTPTDPKLVYNLLDETIRHYIEFEKDSDYIYFNLWNIATYFYELFDAFPYNDFTGTKRAGKTKCLEFQKLVCFNPIMSADMSGSSMFRIIEGLGATVLLDESEQFKKPKK